MDLLKIIFLGILQGITEFLPVSSDGHLVIAESLLGEKLESAALNIALHVGSLGSILVVYRDRIARLVTNKKVFVSVVIATLPLVAVGVPLKLLLKVLEDSPYNPIMAGFGLFVTAFYLLRSQRITGGQGTLEEVTPKQALLVGVLQAIAVAPGISRSGGTIYAGLRGGLSRQTAADFSFLIAIPAILGATVLYAKDIAESGSGGLSPGLLLLGAAVSFVTGVFVLRWLLKIVVGGDLRRFAWYCIALGTVVVVWQGTLLLGTPGKMP